MFPILILYAFWSFFNFEFVKKMVFLSAQNVYWVLPAHSQYTSLIGVIGGNAKCLLRPIEKVQIIIKKAHKSTYKSKKSVYARSKNFIFLGLYLSLYLIVRKIYEGFAKLIIGLNSICFVK